jgi:predicted small lipoprotein YifL
MRVWIPTLIAVLVIVTVLFLAGCGGKGSGY